MKITILMKSVYGEWRAYPACEKSRLFADMLGTKTLTDTALLYIKRLGYSIDTTHPQVSMTEYTR